MHLLNIFSQIFHPWLLVDLQIGQFKQIIMNLKCFASIIFWIQLRMESNLKILIFLHLNLLKRLWSLYSIVLYKVMIINIIIIVYLWLIIVLFAFL